MKSYMEHGQRETDISQTDYCCGRAYEFLKMAQSNFNPSIPPGVHNMDLLVSIGNDRCPEVSVNTQFWGGIFQKR